MTLRNSIFDRLDNSSAPTPHPDSWVSRRPPAVPAHEAVRAALKAQAKRTARSMIKERARDYALRPRELDMFTVGACRLSPRKLVIFLKLLTATMHDRLAMTPMFGGEIPAINLRAAMWYARWNRAIASRKARRKA